MRTPSQHQHHSLAAMLKNFLLIGCAEGDTAVCAPTSPSSRNPLDHITDSDESDNDKYRQTTTSKHSDRASRTTTWKTAALRAATELDRATVMGAGVRAAAPLLLCTRVFINGFTAPLVSTRDSALSWTPTHVREWRDLSSLDPAADDVIRVTFSTGIG